MHFVFVVQYSSLFYKAGRINFRSIDHFQSLLFEKVYRSAVMKVYPWEQKPISHQRKHWHLCNNTKARFAALARLSTQVQASHGPGIKLASNVKINSHNPTTFFIKPSIFPSISPSCLATKLVT